MRPSREGDPARQCAGDVLVVGDHDDRRAFGVEAAEEADDVGRGSAVEVAGRFVGEHDRRVADDRSGDGDALAFAAGELRRLVVDPVGEPDSFECFGGEGSPAAAAHALVEQPGGDVVERG